MRIRKHGNTLSVRAIAGSHVVLLGFDVEDDAREGLLGFAIHRTDGDTNRARWLQGFRTFEKTFRNPRAGTLVSTEKHPIQAFVWGDYTARPGVAYEYRVTAIYGTPARLRRGEEVAVQVTTEIEDAGKHAVWFNRGVAASQAYARKFGNLRPNRVPDRKAFVWLSRGLEEAMLAFIAQANGPNRALRAAVYEFSYRPVLEALANAGAAGADVRIVFDARRGANKPRAASLRAIAETGIGDLVTERTTNPSFIAHNKFIVLLEDGVPTQVWTGSTNLTEGGIFGQSNIGHLVRDRRVARAYLAYWKQLAQDPEAADLRVWNTDASPLPQGKPPPNSTRPIFSPRTSLDALDWYAARFGAADTHACFTAAFGVNPVIAKQLVHAQGLHYLLLEKPDELLETGPVIRVAAGSRIEPGMASRVHRWLAERLTGLNNHVRYVHTKYLLVDHLSDDPLVITGSANFSKASTFNNDENMLVIRGDQRVADIYLGEFMRLFNHLFFRDIARRASARRGAPRHDSQYLTATDSWTERYFEPGTPRFKERELFR